MRNKIFLTVGILLGIGFIWYKLYSNQEKVNQEIKAEKQALPFAVEAVAITKSEFSGSNTYTGRIEATGTVTVAAETDGRVARMAIENGSKVQKGQVIAVLENPLKKPTYEIHQADYNKAKTDYLRFKELQKQNNATGIELEAARHAMETAEKQMKMSGAEMNRSIIRSPVSGVVSAKPTNTGDYLSVGSPVAVIVPLNQLEVRFNVPEKEISAIGTGQAIRFTADAYPGHQFTARVSSVIPLANQAKSFPVLAKANNNQQGMTLMGGMSVNVTVAGTPNTSALVVPRTAIRGEVSSPYVWLVSHNKKAVKRNLKTGKELGDQVEIISGLDAGDCVVTKGQANLTEGIILQSVKIVNRTNL